MFIWKDENKWKRGRGWPIFLKNKCKLLKIDEILPLLTSDTSSVTRLGYFWKVTIVPAKVVEMFGDMLSCFYSEDF